MNFKFATSILSSIDMHAIIYNGEFLVWRSLLNLPNRQIKNLLAKVSHYTVCDMKNAWVHINITTCIYFVSLSLPTKMVLLLQPKIFCCGMQHYSYNIMVFIEFLNLVHVCAEDKPTKFSCTCLFSQNQLSPSFGAGQLLSSCLS